MNERNDAIAVVTESQNRNRIFYFLQIFLTILESNKVAVLMDGANRR